MPAYWVARSRIIDPVEYKKYTDRIPAIIAKHGGKVLARGGRFQIMEGPDKFHRFVVIEKQRRQRCACPKLVAARGARSRIDRIAQTAQPIDIAPQSARGHFQPF